MFGRSSVSPTQHVIFRTEGKPLRFTGVLLAARTILDEDRGESDTRVRLFRTDKGSLIWAGDRIEHGYDDPDPEQIQRADALVISATDGRSPVDVATEAWERRPASNAKLSDASIRVWHDAAPLDERIAKVFYIEVD